jgi:hypothetical protein
MRFHFWPSFSICAAHVALLASTVLIPSDAQTQTLSEQQLSELPPELANQLRNVPVRDILSGKFKPRMAQPEGSERDREWTNPLPITLHLKGDEGKVLPTAASLVEARRKAAASRENPESEEKVKELYQKSLDAFTQLGQKPKNPRDCFKSLSTFTAFEKPLANGVAADILFIKESDIPQDPEEAFGSRVQLVRYGERTSASWAQFGDLQGVQCLPTRILILGNGVRRIEGSTALRDFSEDPQGEGKLSSVVASKLGSGR